MKIGETKHEILLIIVGLCTSNYKTYCYPSRDKILILLKLFYKKDISLSTLDQHLSELNKTKYMISFPQKDQLPNGTWYNKVSNRQLTKKGVWFLVKHGSKFVKWFMDWIRKGILPKALRKAHNLAKLNKEKKSESGKSYENLHSWLKTPSIILVTPT